MSDESTILSHGPSAGPGPSGATPGPGPVASSGPDGTEVSVPGGPATSPPDGGPLDALVGTLRTFAEEREWQQFHTPKNLAMALAGEVGELLAELQWLTPEQAARVMDDPEAGGRVRAEIGDVMIYLVRLADVLGIDLVRAATDKLADSARRYPVEESRGTAAKARRQ